MRKRIKVILLYLAFRSDEQSILYHTKFYAIWKHDFLYWVQNKEI